MNPRREALHKAVGKYSNMGERVAIGNGCSETLNTVTSRIWRDAGSGVTSLFDGRGDLAFALRDAFGTAFLVPSGYASGRARV